MKKLLVVLVLAAVATGAFAQDVFASYNEPGDFNLYASIGYIYDLEVSVGAEYILGEFALGPLPFDWGLELRGQFEFDFYGGFYYGLGALATLHTGLSVVPLEFYVALGLGWNNWNFLRLASYNGLTWWFSDKMGLLLEGGYVGWSFWGIGLEFKL